MQREEAAINGTACEILDTWETNSFYLITVTLWTLSLLSQGRKTGNEGKYGSPSLEMYS